VTAGGLLGASALLAGAATFAFKLHDKIWWFDEAVHAYSTFVSARRT